MKNYEKMTRREFECLPHRGWNESIGDYDCLIILPLRKKHESGYRCMDFVAVKDNEALYRLSGYSDVINIEGIAGYGWDWLHRYSGCPKLVPPTEWSIDCLPVSGLLRMWPRGKIRNTPVLSSFEIYQVPNA